MQSAGQADMAVLCTQAHLVGTPTSKVATIDAFAAHVRWRVSKLRDVLAFTHARKVRRLRWGSFMRKQAALDKLCNEITGGEPDAIVAYGDADFAPSGPGNRAVPNKAIQHVLRTKCRCMIFTPLKPAAGAESGVG